MTLAVATTGDPGAPGATPDDVMTSTAAVSARLQQTALAMINARPAALAVTIPIVSTVAIDVLKLLHTKRVFGTT